MQRNRLTTIFIVVLIDLLGFGLILPLLPYYAATFGLSTAAIGLLIAAYPAAQLVSTPLLGRLSDRLGRPSAVHYRRAAELAAGGAMPSRAA